LQTSGKKQHDCIKLFTIANPEHKYEVLTIQQKKKNNSKVNTPFSSHQRQGKYFQTDQWEKRHMLKKSERKYCTGAYRVAKTHACN